MSDKKPNSPALDLARRMCREVRAGTYRPPELVVIKEGGHLRGHFHSHLRQLVRKLRRKDPSQ